jgi:hypothetical protein
MRRATPVLLALGLAVATTAHASNPVRISQVYGGGGNYYKCDYVELFNNSESPVDIGGWSLQYAAATGATFGLSTYNYALIPGGATIPACGHYLIRGYCGTAGANLPVTPDLSPSSPAAWSFNLHGTDGKVALFGDQVLERTCAQALAVAVDLVGYGVANCYETAAAPANNVSSVLVRAAGGAVDSDDNSTDLNRGAQPWPMHNAASPRNPDCLLGSHPPDPAALVAPLAGAAGVAVPAALTVTASDQDADSLTVRFFGRPVPPPPPPGPEFSLVLIPDTQIYTEQSGGGTNAIFKAQTQWIVNSRVGRNIAAVAHLGDITDNDATVEYMRADTAMKTLENPATTGLADGIPYVMDIGNHDGSSGFNQFFGVSRFSGRGYYGGHYGSSNDNSYILFSGAGLDFILLSLAYAPSSAVLTWAHGVLAANPGRLGIVVSHSIVNDGTPAPWSSEGQAIYDALKDRPNLILMACGHLAQEGRRTDVLDGRPVTSMLSDYQWRANGGSGWLRILEFAPAANQVRVRTYSPWLNQWETDADSSSQFTLNGVPLGGTTQPGFAPLGTVAGVPSGSNAVLPWSGLAAGTPHEWYVSVSDRQTSRTGPVWGFTTASSAGVGDRGQGGLALAPPAPNPARGTLRLSFDLPRAMRVRLDVVDVQGRVVATLAEGDLGAGRHERAWDVSVAGAPAGGGAQARAGLYFVRLETPEERRVRRVVLLDRR